MHTEVLDATVLSRLPLPRVARGDNACVFSLSTRGCLSAVPCSLNALRPNTNILSSAFGVLLSACCLVGVSVSVCVCVCVCVCLHVCLYESICILYIPFVFLAV